MNRRALTILPILLGGATGAAFAWIGAEPVPMPARSKPAKGANAGAPMLASATEVPLAGASARAEPTSDASVGKEAGADSVANLVDGALPIEIAGRSASPTAPPEVVPEPTSAPKVSPAFDLSELGTKEELLSAERRCNQKSPADCERAANAVAQGTLVAKDPARASMLRRIALTLYVKQCETGRAATCARLAEMYEQGILVQPNPRSASALRDRVLLLCKAKGEDPVCRSP